MLEAVEKLKALQELINLEAFPGMRLKDTDTIRHHIDEIVNTFAVQVAAAKVAKTGHISPAEVRRIKKEAEEAVLADVERQILDNAIPKEEE